VLALRLVRRCPVQERLHQRLRGARFEPLGWRPRRL